MPLAQPGEGGSFGPAGLMKFAALVAFVPHSTDIETPRRRDGGPVEIPRIAFICPVFAALVRSFSCPVPILRTDPVPDTDCGPEFAASYVALMRGSELVVSFMTLAEMRHGALEANRGRRKCDVPEEYLADFSVLHSDSLLCSMWAAVRNESTRKGRQMGSADAWIAATALALSVPLVTNNPKDYRHLDRLQLSRRTGRRQWIRPCSIPRRRRRRRGSRRRRWTIRDSWSGSTAGGRCSRVIAKPELYWRFESGIPFPGPH